MQCRYNTTYFLSLPGPLAIISYLARLRRYTTPASLTAPYRDSATHNDILLRRTMTGPLAIIHYLTRHRRHNIFPNDTLPKQHLTSLHHLHSRPTNTLPQPNRTVSYVPKPNQTIHTTGLTIMELNPSFAGMVY
jgi:hypothetical protein